MSLKYNLPAILSAYEEVMRVHAQTLANREASVQVLNQNAAHMGGETAGAFQQALTAVNSAYEAAIGDINMAGHAVQQAAEHAQNTDHGLATRYV